VAQHSDRFGFDVPDDYPLALLETVHARLSDGGCAVYAVKQDVWQEWAGGCNGTLYRFLQAAEASDAWAEAIRIDRPGLDERLRQEFMLFSFFASALSSLECLAYGLCAVGQFLRPSVFHVTTRPHTITFGLAATKFSSEFPNDRLGPVLATVDQSREMNDLRGTRNILSHRSAPGRTYSETLTVGSDSASGATTWLAAALGSSTTGRPRAWVAGTLQEILQAADEFTTSHL
jgi:hypothetical protein